MRLSLSIVAFLFVVLGASAQIDKTGYTLIYSSETPEAASAELTLTDEEKACCTSDFMSTENFERNWNYCAKQGSKWNMRNAETAEDRAKVNVCDGDGVLRLLALSLDGTKDNCITGAIQMKNGYKYGIYEIKAKCNPHKSNFPAIWMMPKTPHGGWPSCGEYDIMEQIGTSSTAYSTVHCGSRYSASQGGVPVGKNYTYSGSKKTTAGEYHIYTLKWDKTSLTTYVDGTQFFRYTKDTTLDYVNHPEYEHSQFPYNEEFYIILDQALGTNANWGSEDPDPSYTYEMDVEYVRIFQAPQEEEVTTEYLIQNRENPTYYMVATADGLACSEDVDLQNPADAAVWSLPANDSGTTKKIRTRDGQYVMSKTVTNVVVPLGSADEAVSYNVITDSEKGTAFDYFTTDYPLTYSNGGRALIMNISKNNMVTISGTTKATAWWNLVTLEEAAAGITDVNADKAAAAVKKVIRDGQIVIANGDKEYTVAGSRVK